MAESLSEELLQPDKLPAASEAISKDPWEREVDGIYNAMLFIHQKARLISNGGLDRQDILNIHKIVMDDPLNPEKTGVLRTSEVIVRGKINGEVREAAFTPTDTHFLSEYFNEFCTELEERTQNFSISTDISGVIETATWAHHRFIEIHPFEDGNGRTVRLIVDFIFRKARLPYIRDWGAKGDEYNNVVYRIYSENNLNLLKFFLAKKLYNRLEEIESKYASKITNGKGFLEYVKGRMSETHRYLGILSTNNAS